MLDPQPHISLSLIMYSLRERAPQTEIACFVRYLKIINTFFEK